MLLEDLPGHASFDLLPLDSELFAAASAPRDPGEVKLLVVDSQSGAAVARPFQRLDEVLRPGDLLVLNDAATLPALLPVRVRGEACELRLSGVEPWRGALIRAADAREPVELRPPAPAVHLGEELALDGFSATVTAVEPSGLLHLRFSLRSDALWAAIYRVGRPVRYEHIAQPLHLWDVQTRYAARPLAVEAPSAGLPLTWALLSRLRARGVGLATVTHAAGLSVTGIPAIDAELPLPELSLVPAATADAVARTRAGGGRVIAAGTSVARALEGAVEDGQLRAGERTVSLKLGPHSRLQVVDGLLTGMHAPGESHHRLIQAFLPQDRLDHALRIAAARGFLAHEFGDALLVL